MTKAVLLIEDNSPNADLIKQALLRSNEESFVVERVRKCSEAERRLATDNRKTIAAVITSLFLPDSQGIQTIDRILEVSPKMPILVLTNSDHEHIAKQAIQRGAQDYVLQHRLDNYLLPKIVHNMLYRAANIDALFAEKERVQGTLNSIGDAVITTDGAGRVTYLNQVAEAMTGWSLREVLGRKFKEVFRIVDNSNTVQLNPMTSAIQHDRAANPVQGAVLTRRDGLESAIEDSVAPIHDRDGNILGAVMVFRDVTESRAAILRMLHLAQHDPLTGLPSRLVLNDRIAQAVTHARRHQEQFAVLYVDIDRFKHVNDSLGHSIGDQLLLSIAKRLIANLRSSDSICRQGRDEFVVLMPGMGRPEDAALSAQKILTFLSSPHCIEQHNLHVTASIGVSLYPDDGEDSQSLVANAGAAMFNAKQQGRNTYGFFKPHLNEQAIERRFLESSLRHALERGEFSLHYQPIMDLRSEKLSGAEALVRWRRPNGGMALAGQFVPGAEQCGYMITIGQWVLREACRQTQSWIDAGLSPIPVSVNISALELRSRDFVQSVRDILRETRLDPRYLKLEIAEVTLVKQHQSSAAVMHLLRDMGVTLTLDRFGTGFSSLPYLRRFPVDALKIDSSLIRGLCINPSDASIINAVISAGMNSHLRVIAQGVETHEQFQILQSQRCAEGQGSYFREPAAASEFAKLLEVGFPSGNSAQ